MHLDSPPRRHLPAQADQPIDEERARYVVVLVAAAPVLTIEQVRRLRVLPHERVSAMCAVAWRLAADVQRWPQAEAELRADRAAARAMIAINDLLGEPTDPAVIELGAGTML